MLALAACDQRILNREATINGSNFVPGSVPVLIVSPANLQLIVGTTAQLQTNAPELFSQVQWTSTQPAVAAVNTTGLVTGLTIGTAAIIARYSFDTLNSAAVGVVVIGVADRRKTGRAIMP